MLICFGARRNIGQISIVVSEVSFSPRDRSLVCVSKVRLGKDTAMAKQIIAHFTDSHLGQKLVMAGEMARDQMRYDNQPEEHKDRLRLVLDDIASKVYPMS